MKKIFIAALIIFLSNIGITNAQVKFKQKIEVSGYLFQRVISPVRNPDNSLNNFIPNEQSALGFDVINGVKFKKDFYAGFGIGYQDFQGYQGISLYSDFEYTAPFFTGKWIPFLDARVGYSRLMNQYPDGTGTLYAEGGVGVSYSLSPRYQLYLQTGLTSLQKSLLIPIHIGLRF